MSLSEAMNWSGCKISPRCVFWGVGPRARRLKSSRVPRTAVQGVMRGTIFTITVNLKLIEVVLGSRAAIIYPRSMPYAKLITRSFLVSTPRIMTLLADQSRELVTRPGAAVHSSDRPFWNCRLKRHIYEGSQSCNKI